MNTIFAQCSAHGKSGIAVFRISGPNALKALEFILRRKIDNLEARMLYLRKIYHPKKDIPIDEAMIVFFKKNASFTGEDSVEIYTHGSLAVIKLMNEALISIDDLRLAEPGEFAKRAFLNGRMDLTSAEGLADLIEAETEMQHRQAIMQLGGSLEKIYEKWRKQLLEIIGLVEAYIDFPDEDIPPETLEQIDNFAEKLIAEIKMHLDDNNRGERLRDGIKLAVIGKPNVGKSSLINYLMQREVSIVSNIAGTTRDVIEAHIDIGGYPIILQDTAGINADTTDEIEREGIVRAWKAAKNSDIKIILFDASNFETESFAEDKNLFSEVMNENMIIVFNKIDIASNNVPKRLSNVPVIGVSVKERHNLEILLNEITYIAEKIASPSESPQITRARHRSQLERALEYMNNFSIHDDLVLAAEDLRMTMRSISNITGKITVDEILGEIFGNFCIGK